LVPRSFNLRSTSENGTESEREEIDYSVTAEVLFTRFASHFATRISDLNDIPKDAGVSQNTNMKTLPTWVPDWEQHVAISTPTRVVRHLQARSKLPMA